jgi:hypothetical protein
MGSSSQIRTGKEPLRVQEICTYQIKVRGQVDEKRLNATSPFQVSVTRSDAVATLLTVRADQSGLVGLIRHLHGQGFLLQSVNRE